MKIAVAQIDCRLGDVDANVAHINAQIERAGSAACDLVLLPELVDTGYEMNVILEKAAGWESGPVDEIRKQAVKCGIAVCCGLSERVDGHIYNSQALISRDGAIVAHYRKAHLFTASPVQEERLMQAGEALVVTQFGDLKIGLMICYDIRFPEMARALALQGVDLFLVSAAWPGVRVEHWRTLLAARAIENQAYVAAANRCGTDGPVAFGGNSVLLDPGGIAVAPAASSDETMLIGEVSREWIEKTRSQMAVFQDRRADLYDLNP